MFDDQYLIEESLRLPIDSIGLNRGPRDVDRMQFRVLLCRTTRIRFPQLSWLLQAATIVSALNGSDWGEV